MSFQIRIRKLPTYNVQDQLSVFFFNFVMMLLKW
jgi:hypothetical protein